MPRLSDQEIARLAADAGFSGQDLETAVAVALAESRGDSDAVGDVNIQTDVYGPSIGLWQIRSVNPGHANRFEQQHHNEATNYDPATNARNAHAIFERRGWRPWSTYTRGNYRQFLDRARNAVQSNSGQQTPGQRSESGGNGMNATPSELFGAMPKLLASGDRLNNVSKAAANGTVASPGSFGLVPGSRDAETGNKSNASRSAKQAEGAGKRVNGIGSDVEKSGKEYEGYDQNQDQLQRQQYQQLDSAYDPYSNLA
ncbi:transglycosylase SLT domain-containing protein [Actinophytocola sp.]|uniref:transglycosylase SLT domain-containing protein n=1 Tax=Actinophytocola sp. TaxID=1872138 RepID=UPI002ED27043